MQCASRLLLLPYYFLFPIFLLSFRSIAESRICLQRVGRNSRFYGNDK